MKPLHAPGLAKIVSNEPSNGTLLECRCWFCLHFFQSLTLLHLSRNETHRVKEKCPHCKKPNLFLVHADSPYDQAPAPKKLAPLWGEGCGDDS